MNEVGEFVGVADEEHGGVVADEIPVAFFGIELDGETADVAFGIGGAAFSGDRRESEEGFGLFADMGEDVGFGVLSDIFSDRECAVCARTFSVDYALGDALAVEVLHLFKQLNILHEKRAARAGGEGLLASDRGAVSGGELF